MRVALLRSLPAVVRRTRTVGSGAGRLLALSRPASSSARTTAPAQRPSAANATATAATPDAPTSASAGGSGSGGDGGGAPPPPKDSSSSNLDGLPTWEAIARMTPGDQAYLISTLPLFRHTCLGAPKPTWSNTSKTCAEQLRQDLGGVSWRSSSIYGLMLSTLARYVQVPTSPVDILVGAQEAELLLSDYFNTFHLAESRKRLRSIASPQVYRAVENTWRLLDQMGLRMQYKVTIVSTFFLDVNVHDSDQWNADGTKGGGGGGGGGGGIAIPVEVNLGTPRVVRPPSSSSSTMRAQVPPSSSSSESASSASNPASSAADAAGSSTTGSSGKKPTDRAVRYADLDVQYVMLETMEMWSVRADQKLEPLPEPSMVDLEKEMTPEDLKEYKEMEEITKKHGMPNLYGLEDRVREEQSAALLDKQLKRMQEAVEAVESAAAFVPRGGVAAVAAAPSTGSTSAAAGASSSSSSATSSANASLPTSTNFPPPLALLTTITGESERGLRFYTDLPEEVTGNQEGVGLLWAPPESPDPTAGRPFLAMFKGWAQRFAGVPTNVHTFPKPNWIIKDILD